MPDETDILQLRSGQSIADGSLRKWLNPDVKDVEATKPNLDAIKDEIERKKTADIYAKRLDLVDTLKSGTNIGGSAMQIHKLENNSLIQAYIIYSDGQSNVGSHDTLMEFISRANNSKRYIPVITVGVGQFRQPASIIVDDLQAPEQTRPDDKFPVRVPVIGRGLHGEEFTVKLEAMRVKDATGKVVGDPAQKNWPFMFPDKGVKTGTFKGQGDNPQDVIEFEIDVQDMMKIKAQDDKNGDLEGEWQFRARVPRNPKEPFAEAEHITEPIKVQVQKRALRVLLFAGGATREYIFLRTILFREMQEKRMEMSIYLQTGKEDHIDQDVEPDRLLLDFPNVVGPSDQKFMSLSDYDVIVAFDPDWSKLNSRQFDRAQGMGGHARRWVHLRGRPGLHPSDRASGRPGHQCPARDFPGCP